MSDVRQPHAQSDVDSWGSQSQAEDAGYQQLVNGSDSEEDDVPCDVAAAPVEEAAARQAAAEVHAEQVFALLEQSLQLMEADYAATLAMERRLSAAVVVRPAEAAPADVSDGQESDGSLAEPLAAPSELSTRTGPAAAAPSSAAAAKPARVAPLLAPPSSAARPELDAALDALLQRMALAGEPALTASDA